MIYTVILAGGSSDKLHRLDTPRPFLMLGSKPIIIHTMEQFVINSQVDKIIIAVSDEWILHTHSMLLKWLPNEEDIPIVGGGENKADTLRMVVEYIDTHYGIKDDDIILAHDAIRPFITQRIIDENIAAGKNHHAVSTVMITTDTIIRSTDGKKISEIPPKDHMFAEQTPLTFNGKVLKGLFDVVGEEATKRENEIVRIFINQGIEIYMVRGEYSNMKLISPYDLEVANALLKETRHD